MAAVPVCGSVSGQEKRYEDDPGCLALAGRPRRAQTFLRTLGIEITFSREGRTGTRMIRVSTSAENTVSTVSIVSAAHYHGSRGDQANLARVRE
jgi:hypothetical protein